MAFCTGCGKPLEDGARFCTSCGAAVTVGSAAVPVSEVNSTAAAAPAPAPESAPAISGTWEQTPKASSGVPAMVIGIGVALVLLVGIGAGVTLLLRSRDSSGARTTSAAPIVDGNSISLLNLPSYPGAQPIVTSSAGDVISAFRTKDTPQQVIGFYKVRFPVSQSLLTENGEELTADLPGSGRVRILAESTPSGTEVQISRQR